MDFYERNLRNRHKGYLMIGLVIIVIIVILYLLGIDINLK